MIKLAIIAPSFFSYIEAIRDEFRKKGIECDIYDERHSNSILSKISYRLRLSIVTKKKKDTYYKGLIQSINCGSYTDVLLVGTEVIDKSHLKKIKKSGAKVHIYMWDSVKNKPNYLDYLHELFGKSSFEIKDCNTYHMKYIPLFAEDLFSIPCDHQKNKRFIDISFCGTLHTHRSLYLYKLQQVSNQLNLKIEFLLYFHSKILFL